MAEKFSLTAQLHLQAPKNVKQVFNQIQGQLKGASVDVEVKKGTQAVKDLGKIASATKKVEQEAKAATSATDKMGKAFGSALKNVLRYDLARRVFTAFTNTLEQGVKDAIQFEREMIKIAQVSGQTMKQLKGLQNTVTQLATSLGVSSSSLVKIGLILKQTGLSVKDTQLAMSALAKTELAPTFDNIADTAETAVAAMRQFGIEASRLEGLLSKINTVAANFAVEASDIGVAIKRAGGAFKAAGGEVEELIALFTSVRATTRETAETIATGFRTIFTRLQRPTTIKFLRQFGIELTDLNGKFVGPYEAVKRLSNALKGISPQDLRFSTIVEQLGGFRQVSKVIPLIQEFGTSQAALNAQLEGSDSLAKDAATAQQSLAVQMQKVTENVKEMFRTMVQSDAFQTIASLALKLADAITKIGKALAPVLPILGAFVAARAAAWAGGKMMGGGLGGLNKALGTASGDASDVFRGNRGGRVRRFSRGGWVPGTGNGDTVPAMLEPGEFVLRKSAAQAFGSRLNGVNKYQSGGRAKNMAAAQLKYKSTTDGDSLNVDFVPRRRWQNSSSRLLGYDAYEKGSAKAKKKGTLKERMLGNYATTAMDKYIKGKSAKQIKAMFDEGDAFAPSKMKYGRLPFRASNFGASLVRQGLAVKEKDGPATGNLAKKINAWAEMELQKPGSASYPKTGPAAGDYKGWVHDRAMRLKRDRQKAATAKPLERASGGLVPSLLTPGEFVVNKKSAQSMGYGKLRKMNKYAGGGTVSRFAGGGGVGAGGGMGAMMNLAFLQNFRKGTVEATKGLYKAGESGFYAYLQTQMYGASVSAVTSTLGIQNDKLDGFISLLTNSLSIISAFNAVMATAAAEKGVEGFSSLLSTAGDAVTMFGGRFKGGKGLIGKVTGKAGGTIGNIGKNVSNKSFGLFATKQTKYATATTKLTQRALAPMQNARQLAGVARGKAAKLADARKAFEALPKGSAARKAAGGRLGGLTKSANAARKTADAAKAAAKAGKAGSKATLKLASRTAKAAQMFKALNVAGFVATYAVGKLGDAISDSAMQEIKDTGGGGGYRGMFGSGETGLKTKAAAGGALSGAATGAAIGMFLGPWGAAVGALIGGIWGAVKAWKNAEEAISAAKFTAAFDNITSTMEDFEKGLISSSSALASTIQQFEIMSNEQALMSEGGGIKEQAAARKSIKTLTQATADNAKSVEQFDREMADALPIIHEHTIYTKDDIQAIRDSIQARVDSQKKMEEYAAAQERARKELEKLRGISTVLSEMENRMSQIDVLQGSITNPAGAARIGGGVEQLIQTGSRDEESINRLETTIDKLGNLAGEGDTGLSSTAQQAKDFAFLDRNIGQALTVASTRDNLSPDRIQDVIMKQLEGQTRVEGGEEMSDWLKKHLEGVFSGLSDEDLADIEGNREKLAAEFKKGADEAYETYKKAAQLVDNQTKRLASMYEARRSLEQKYIQQQKDLLGKRQSIEQEYLDNIAGTSGRLKGITNEEVQANFSARQRVALSGVGGQVSGMGALGDLPTDVDSVAAAFKTVSAQLRESNEDFSKMGVDPSVLTEQEALASGINKQLVEHDKLTKQYQTLQGVLKDYENVQQRLVAINRDLAKSQQRDKTFRQMLDDMMYGTAEEKEASTQNVAAIMKAFSEGTIHTLRPELQRAAAEALRGGLMGQEGIDILDRDAKNFGAAYGIDMTGALAGGASEETKRLAEEKRAIQREGVKASGALSGETKTEIDEMSAAITKANNDFLTGLKALFQEEHDRRLREQNEVAAAELKNLGEQAALYNKLIQKMPERLRTAEGIENARQFVGQNVEEYQKRVKSKERMELMGRGGSRLKNVVEDAGGLSWLADNMETYGEGDKRWYQIQDQLMALEPLMGSVRREWQSQGRSTQGRTAETAMMDEAIKMLKKRKQEAGMEIDREALNAIAAMMRGGKVDFGNRTGYFRQDASTFGKGGIFDTARQDLKSKKGSARVLIDTFFGGDHAAAKTALSEGFFGGNYELREAGGASGRELQGVFRESLQKKFVEQGKLFEADEMHKLFDTTWDQVSSSGGTAADFMGQMMNAIAQKQDKNNQRIAELQAQAQQVTGSSTMLGQFTDAQAAQLLQAESYEKVNEAMKKQASAIDENVKLTHQQNILKKAALYRDNELAAGRNVSFSEAKTRATQAHNLTTAITNLKKKAESYIPSNPAQHDKTIAKNQAATQRAAAEITLDKKDQGYYAAQTMYGSGSAPAYMRGEGYYTHGGRGKPSSNPAIREAQRKTAAARYRMWQDQANQSMLTDMGYNPEQGYKTQQGMITEVGGKKLDKAIPQAWLPDPAEANKFYQKATTKSATSSIYTHDHIAHGILREMLDVLKAPGGDNTGDVLLARTGIQNRQSDVTVGAGGGGLSDLVERFSTGAEQLATLMASPLTITVGGTITMDVKLNGAEWFRDAEDSLKQMAGKQITAGINNFIRHGLKDAKVQTKDDWVDSGTGLQGT